MGLWADCGAATTWLEPLKLARSSQQLPPGGGALSVSAGERWPIIPPLSAQNGSCRISYASPAGPRGAGEAYTVSGLSDEFRILPGVKLKYAARACPLLEREAEEWVKCCTRRFEFWENNSATLRPSFVRMWRRDRFSFWLGAGAGLEFEYSRWHFRQVRQVYNEDGNEVGLVEGEAYGTLVQDEHFTSGDSWSRHFVLVGSFGVSASLTRRTVLRFGYACMLRYLDEPLAGAIEVGIGYRF